MKGVVVKSTGSWYLVRTADGNLHECRMKGKLRIEGFKATNPVVVGDHVLIDFRDGATIAELLPRQNYIIRKATNLSKQAHIIAANIDQALLVATMSMPRTSLGFIDRFLITAEAYRIPVKMVFNKIDILSEEEKVDLEGVRALYNKIGYESFTVSSLTGEGISELKNCMINKVNLVSGHSGVGKSSLLNNLSPELNLRIGNLSDVHQKGTHTTTFAEMFELTNNTFVIDTPGIKEFGMIDIEKNELSHFFPEMRKLFNQCKFNSCLHVNEPKCAVLSAVETGEIAESRYNTYLNILNGEELLKDYEK